MTCAHHWVIAEPNGATSRGRCKRCGAEKDFANSEEHTYWQQDGQARRQRAAQATKRTKAASKAAAVGGLFDDVEPEPF